MPPTRPRCACGELGCPVHGWLDAAGGPLSAVRAGSRAADAYGDPAPLSPLPSEAEARGRASASDAPPRTYDPGRDPATGRLITHLPLLTGH